MYAISSVFSKILLPVISVIRWNFGILDSSFPFSALTALNFGFVTFPCSTPADYFGSSWFFREYVGCPSALLGHLAFLHSPLKTVPRTVFRTLRFPAIWGGQVGKCAVLVFWSPQLAGEMSPAGDRGGGHIENPTPKVYCYYIVFRLSVPFFFGSCPFLAPVSFAAVFFVCFRNQSISVETGPGL